MTEVVGVHGATLAVSGPASTKAWAGPDTARVAPWTPTTSVMAGSWRSSGGSERRLTGSG